MKRLWLTSAHEELILKPSWKATERVIFEHMKQFIDQHLNNATCREILFYLAGERFVRKYYKNFKPRARHLLFEPYMTRDVRTSLCRDYYHQLIDSVTVEQVDPMLLSDLSDIYHRYSSRCRATDQSIVDVLTTRDGVFTTNRIIRTCLDLTLGRTVMMVLNANDATLESQIQMDQTKLFRQLEGRSLPSSLRRYLYRAKLFRPCKVEETRKVIQANALLSCISDPRESAISKLLSRLIQEIFNSTLSSFASERMIRVQNETLNQFYVSSSLQSSRYVFLLLPLAYEYHDYKDPVVLVSLLSVFLGEYCHHSSSNVKEGCRYIEREISKRDSHLSCHLKTFGDADDIFGPWIERCFVGYLSLDAMFFVWDTCFLSERCNFKRQIEWFAVEITLLFTRELQQQDTLEGVHNIATKLSTKRLRQRYSSSVNPNSKITSSSISP